MTDREQSKATHNAEAVDGRVLLVNNDDDYYREWFDSWDQVNAFIAKMRTAAHVAFGPDQSENDE